ncbi:hypothetical protein [Leptolyngbya sp. 7M]|uniref:hypothetical protein n=1 Tax=Leptolyngbya sp. 7M TaxID=2812896 RepID=UPI001B8AD9D3|nr:hypothetical protein [Leptolyngbya sp. 7M]QYO67058.1 hypothetical protein JVX88_09755 [Leptolyngbya sp. 7M]
MDKYHETEYRRIFFIEDLPEPLTRSSTHLQIFDNYLPGTRLRLRSIRVPETKEWMYLFQQSMPASDVVNGVRHIAEIRLNNAEHTLLEHLEGNEIRKNRYFLDVEGVRVEYDVYLGPLWGLNRAIYTFSSEREMSEFVPGNGSDLEITNQGDLQDEQIYDKDFAFIQERVADLVGS